MQKVKILIINPGGVLDNFFDRLKASLNDNNIQAHILDIKDFYNVRYPIYTKSSVSLERLDKFIDFELKIYPNWPGLKKDLQKLATDVYSHMSHTLRSNDYQVIVLWNGNKLIDKVAISLAKNKNIKTVYMENGVLPQTTQIDLGGINADSNFWSKITEITPKRIDKNNLIAEIDKLYNTAKPRKKQPVFINLDKAIKLLKLFVNYPALTSARIHLTLRNLRARSIWKKVKPQSIDELKKPYIVVVLQVHDDTQILLNSKYIKSMPQLIDCVYENVEHLLDKYQLIIKEHPEDIGRINYDAFKQKYPKTTWLAKCNVNNLIDGANLVITVNSSMAVEAIVRYKPVVIMGNAFFNIPKVAYSATPQNLKDVIDQALTNPVDEDCVSSFSDKLLHQYLIKGHWTNVQQLDMNTMAKRINDLIKTD